MNNLFFVYTPFQFFVAQNIIMQEKLTNNVLIQGFVSNNVHFYDSYDLMKIDSLWSKTYQIDKLPAYAALEKKTLLKNILRLIKYEKEISRIIKQDEIGALYMGDINNPSCKFSAFNYSRRKIEIVFFEEGASHYYSSHVFTRGGRFLNQFASKALDMFFFKPKYNFSFAKYMFDKSITVKEIPIHTRFSIVPVYHEHYDKQLHVSDIFSKKLEIYIHSEGEKLEAISSKKERILFLSQPIDGASLNAAMAFLNTIKRFFGNSVFCNKIIVLKFHPRDSKEKKIQICNLFKELNLSFHVLSDKYAIPVELYLMKQKFSRIITFFSSTFIYAGYIYPAIPIDYLFTNYFEECEKQHIDVTGIKTTTNNVLNQLKNLTITN